MKKVIKGRLYDTDKAAFVHEGDNGAPRGAFYYCIERLYRKRTGEYFLHGIGGPETSYAQKVPGDQFTYMGGEDIRPLSYEGAREWMEKHAEPEEYEAAFGLPAEDAEHDLHVIISETAWQAISRKAASDGTTVRAIIERLAETLA